MMLTVRNTVAAMLLLFSSPAMAAGSTAGFEMGGRYGRFDPVVSQYNQSGELFRIDGHCQSSCTLFLAIRNVCVSRGATLLFHAAHDRSGNASPSNTEHMLNAYNPTLREYLSGHHYMDTLAFHAISGRDMIRKFGYRECPGR
jgi:predicted amidophosphoribosyltransferase